MRHIRDLLKSVDPADAYAGVDCNSVSFLNIVTVGDILGKTLCGRNLDSFSLNTNMFKRQNVKFPTHRTCKSMNCRCVLCI